jgi:hypothetical protein
MGAKVASAGGKDMNKTGEIRISVLPPLSLSNSASHCCFTALLVPLAGGGLKRTVTVLLLDLEECKGKQQ